MIVINYQNTILTHNGGELGYRKEAKLTTEAEEAKGPCIVRGQWRRRLPYAECLRFTGSSGGEETYAELDHLLFSSPSTSPAPSQPPALAVVSIRLARRHRVSLLLWSCYHHHHPRPPPLIAPLPLLKLLLSTSSWTTAAIRTSPSDWRRGGRWEVGMRWCQREEGMRPLGRLGQPVATRVGREKEERRMKGGREGEEGQIRLFLSKLTTNSMLADGSGMEQNKEETQWHIGNQTFFSGISRIGVTRWQTWNFLYF